MSQDQPSDKSSNREKNSNYSVSRRETLLGIGTIGAIGTGMPLASARGNGNGGGNNTQNVKVNCVSDWSKLAIDTVREGGIEIPVSGRIYAITHTSMFDAVNGVNRARGGGLKEYEPYYVDDTPNQPGASRVAAAAGAGHEALKILSTEDESGIADDVVDDLHSRYDQLLEDHLNDDTDGNSQAGVEWGRYVAQEIYSSRKDSGFFSEDDFDVVDKKEDLEPGMAQRAEQWGSSHLADLKPWAMSSPDAVLPDAPPSLDSDEWAENLERTRKFGDERIGTDEVDELPDDWEEIGIFWVGLAGTAQPDGRWFQIANTIAEKEELDFVDRARLYAQIGMAAQDGGISAWNGKRYYADTNSWRPHAALGSVEQDELVDSESPPTVDDDGNSETEVDPDWEAISSYAASPEYPSGLTAASSASSKVLTEWFGEDYSFEVTVLAAPAGEEPEEYTREFDSFRQAFREARDSREYSGRHYRHSLMASTEMGNEIGSYVIDTLQPK